jgi:hypothetical protein
MAKENSSIDISELAGAISAGIVQATNTTGPVKQIPITKFKHKTPWNPTGRKDSLRPQFTRTYYQNGAQIAMWHVTDADIELLNQLRPGRYFDRKVEVVERVGENVGDHASIEIRYNNASADQRFDLKNYFRNFSEMLRLIVEQQKAA